jgi:hypothetical protein
VEKIVNGRRKVGSRRFRYAVAKGLDPYTATVRITPAGMKKQAYLNWRARVANTESVVIEWRTSQC